MDTVAVFKKAISLNGKEMQTVVAIEELSELQKELTKTIRGIGSKEHLIEEISDVSIMIDQLLLMYGISHTQIDDEKLFKIARLNNRLNERKSDESNCDI